MSTKRRSRSRAPSRASAGSNGKVWVVWRVTARIPARAVRTQSGSVRSVSAEKPSRVSSSENDSGGVARTVFPVTPVSAPGSPFQMAANDGAVREGCAGISPSENAPSRRSRAKLGNSPAASSRSTSNRPAPSTASTTSRGRAAAAPFPLPVVEAASAAAANPSVGRFQPPAARANAAERPGEKARRIIGAGIVPRRARAGPGARRIDRPRRRPGGPRRRPSDSAEPPGC